MIGCDLGSNTLRIVQIDCTTKKRVKAYEKIVRTAKDLHVSGIISQTSKNNIFLALSEASTLFDFKNHKSFCVTTEAMRVAQNAPEILQEIDEKFGLKFEIISGKTEAFLTSLAIENALKREGLEFQNYVLFDLGGGSTEITFCKNGNRKSQSFPFGIINIAEKYKENLEEKVTLAVSTIDAFISNQGNIPHKYQQLIATAGTPTTVCAYLQNLDYAHYDSSKINGKTLHVNDFNKALTSLMALSHEEAERYTGTNRRDLVVVGISIVKALMQKLGFETCIVMDDGLREGVAISNCNTIVS
ncbi:MAG: phosphatase [Campylobacteraceae bacterium]|nr:phosphatase [Campylobacteraceae bacterium]